MSQLDIRHASVADAARIAPLFDAYRQFYEQPADAAAALAFISARLERGESVILLASVDGAPVGFCQMYPSFCSVIAAPIYVLYDLFVAPAARQSGAGRALLREAETHARERGCKRMDLTTARNNATAQSLYESLGWVRDEVFYTYTRDLAA
ncbi:GNAT family N-acetyltransferase [Achromobacter xylosoxidans]